VLRKKLNEEVRKRQAGSEQEAVRGTKLRGR
jgi:hypothetical protein